MSVNLYHDIIISGLQSFNSDREDWSQSFLSFAGRSAFRA